MRIESGATTRYVYFYAVDSTDFTTPETGLTGFTVYRSRNGAAPVSYTTPTVNETDVTNMPGVYELLVDEDTTLASGNDSEEMVLHISKTGMAPVVRTIEIYRPKITLGETLTVSSGLISNTTAIASVSGAVGSVTAAVTLPTIPTNWITADGIATDAIGSAELAASAVTEIQSGLSTLTAQNVADAVWDEVLTGHATLASGAVYLKNTHAHAETVDTSWADGGRLDLILDARASQASVNTIDDFLDTEVAAILEDTGTTIPAQIAALNNLSAAQVTAAVPTATQNADALLNRDMSAVSDTTARSPLNALRLLRNKYSISAGTLTVTKENDTTSAWTATITSDAAADPIIGSDPA